jgi:peroxiredoxin family protein
MKPGEVLEVTATDPGFVADIPAWCRRTGNTLLGVNAKDGNYIARLQKVAEKAAEVQTATTGGNKKTFVCFSCDLDKVLATFVIANGAAAMGNEVTIFFTFWGLNVLRKENPPAVSKGFLDKMFGMMMPKGPNKLKLSKMNMGGMGTLMMKHVMKTKNVISLPDLIGMAMASRVKFVACSMSMDVMGIKAEELIDGVEIAGVGNFLGEADDSNVTMFI